MYTDDMDIEEDLHTKIKKECRSQSPTSTSHPNIYENNENPNNTYDNEIDNFIDLTVEDNEEMANKVAHYREKYIRVQRENDELLITKERCLREIKKLREQLQEEKANNQHENQRLYAEKEYYKQKHLDSENRLQKLAFEVTNSAKNATNSDVKYVNISESYNTPRQS